MVAGIPEVGFGSRFWPGFLGSVKGSGTGRKFAFTQIAWALDVQATVQSMFTQEGHLC